MIVLILAYIEAKFDYNAGELSTIAVLFDMAGAIMTYDLILNLS